MSDIEIVEEQQPTMRSSGKGKVEMTVRFIDSKTGEQVASSKSHISENERRLREEPKY